jgi:hypothetical protein
MGSCTLTDFFAGAAAGAAMEREGTDLLMSRDRHNKEERSGFAALLSETSGVLLEDQAG